MMLILIIVLIESIFVVYHKSNWTILLIKGFFSPPSLYLVQHPRFFLSFLISTGNSLLKILNLLTIESINSIKSINF